MDFSKPISYEGFHPLSVSLQTQNGEATEYCCQYVLSSEGGIQEELEEEDMIKKEG